MALDLRSVSSVDSVSFRGRRSDGSSKSLRYVLTYTMPKHTTLRVHDALLRRAKAYARRHDLTLITVIERALASYLANADVSATQPTPVELPSFGRGGPRPGIDLDDTSALIDIMNG
jgi:hypothetical protein